MPSDYTCPEDWFVDAIDKVQSASIAGQTFHLSRYFVADPNGYFAIIASCVVCEDQLASELRKRLDDTVSEFLREHKMLVAQPFDQPK